MICVGVDVGTRFIKTCLLNGGQLIADDCVRMGLRFDGIVKDSLDKVLRSAGISRRKIEKTAATGYGARHVKKVDLCLPSSACVAAGAHALMPEVRSVVDVGGLFISVASLDAAGRVQETALVEKCATGSGRLLEVVTEALGLSFEQIQSELQKSKDPLPMANQCAVFAESNVISMINQGQKPADVVAGVLVSIAQKSATLLRGLRAPLPYAVTGGVSALPAFVEMLSLELDKQVSTFPLGSRLLGAYGAAVLAGAER
ncbi:MAG: hypothetical protein JRF33_18410 [Deltaproteobacteria bacterium]|nr:hypothetical protein [Deltaproteobacteria bacterium]